MVSRTSFRAGLTGLALLLLTLFAASSVRAADDDALRTILMQLREADFTEKAALIETLVGMDHPRIAAILSAHCPKVACTTRKKAIGW
jgi:hypothetical protein